MAAEILGKNRAREPEIVRLDFSGSMTTSAVRKPGETDGEFAQRVWCEETGRDLAECLDLDNWRVLS